MKPMNDKWRKPTHFLPHSKFLETDDAETKMYKEPIEYRRKFKRVNDLIVIFLVLNAEGFSD